MTDIATNQIRRPPVSKNLVPSKRAEKAFPPFTQDEQLDEPKATSCSRPCSKQCPVSEDQLIFEAQNGISDAIEELLRRNRAVVYRTAYRLTGNAQEAEDVVQETMLRAIKNIDKYRGEARLSSWLIAIAINTVLTAKRKEKRIRWISLDEPIDAGSETLRADSLRDSRMNPEQQYLDMERHVILRRAIAGQHPKFEIILRSCDLDEVPIKEVACMLKITSNAAKSRLFRARQTLRNAFRKQSRNRKLR